MHPSDSSLLIFAVTFICLYAAHHVGDQWIQTNWQATTKGKTGKERWSGRLACGLHVATYTATGAAFLAVPVLLLGLALNTPLVLAGFAISAITHYIADRRAPLINLAKRLRRDRYIAYATVVRRPDEPEEGTGPGTGLYHLDQSWHFAWLFVSAVVMSL